MSEQVKTTSKKVICTENAKEDDINQDLIFHLRDLNHTMRSLYE